MGMSQRRVQLIGRLRHRKTRNREGLVLVEGIRSVREALEAGADAVFAVRSPRLDTLAWGAALRERLESAVDDVVAVDDADLITLADTDHPQGVLLVCRQPDWDTARMGGGSRWLVVDAVQDPGNVGTLVRAATAFALDGVLALDGTADPFGPKAVRASAGTVFRIPVAQLRAEDAVALLAEGGVPLLVADARGDDVAQTPRGARWALAVGNEGAGPRESLQGAAAGTVRIPMPGPAESLNAGVAGAILLYALTREGAGVP